MVADVSPGGMHTGITHPRCFASADANCSIHISKEHVVSATLLRQFAHNGWAKISGLRWQKEKTFDLFPVKRLASKVLCTRHNSALSPLDAEIDDFSRVVGEIDRSIGKADFRDYVISGDNIQLWMLKTVIGMSEAGYIRGSIRPGCIDILYGRMAQRLGNVLARRAWSADIYLRKFSTRNTN